MAVVAALVLQSCHSCNYHKQHMAPVKYNTRGDPTHARTPLSVKLRWWEVSRWSTLLTRWSTAIAATSCRIFPSTDRGRCAQHICTKQHPSTQLHREHSNYSPSVHGAFWDLLLARSRDVGGAKRCPLFDKVQCLSCVPGRTPCLCELRRNSACQPAPWPEHPLYRCCGWSCGTIVGLVNHQCLQPFKFKSRGPK